MGSVDAAGVAVGLAAMNEGSRNRRLTRRNHFLQHSAPDSGRIVLHVKDGQLAATEGLRAAPLLDLSQALLQALKLQTNLRLHGGL